MLLRAFVERFAIDTESISLFYKIFLDEFSSASHTIVKDHCVAHLNRVLRRLDHSLLVSI